MTYLVNLQITNTRRKKVHDRVDLFTSLPYGTINCAVSTINCRSHITLLSRSSLVTRSAITINRFEVCAVARFQVARLQHLASKYSLKFVLCSGTLMDSHRFRKKNATIYTSISIPIINENLNGFFTPLPFKNL